MGGSGDLLTRWRPALAAFDDDALAALANKGLVRRARKDLDSAPPAILGPAGDRLRIAMGDATVEVDPTPSRSSCSCPATGACRHILAALIFLRETAIATEPGAGGTIPEAAMAAPAEEIRSVDDEALAKWAGRPLLARASRALALGLAVTFEEAGAVIARFPSRDATCRWMPGGGLAGMVCSCHATEACEHKVAAVLAFQVADGRRMLDGPEPSHREAAAGAPRTRAEILASVADVARKLVVLGTTRLSRATSERLRTLAVSAHGVDLPRLERMLRGLADEVELGLVRASQADAAGLLARAARVEALAHALRGRPSRSLIGEHRTAYELAGDIEVIGLGARRWRARSGYEGLTVYFWDRSAARWATWSEARPLSVGGLDPASRYLADGPWAGLASPELASRHAFRLVGAYRNRSGRLSGRPSTRAVALSPSDPRAIPARIACWAELADRVRLLFSGGLGDRDEQDELVLLAPARWRPPVFDPIRQELARDVLDLDGRPLPLVLPYTPETKGAVDALEAHDPDARGTDSVLGLLRLEGDRPYVEPIALQGTKGILNLSLDDAPSRPLPHPAARRATPVPEVEEADDGPEPDSGDPIPSATPIGRLLEAMTFHLEMIGAAGFAAFRPIADLRALADRADALGLSSCGGPVGRVVEHIERQRRDDPIDADLAARDLLRAYYVVRLAGAQEAAAVAAARLGDEGSSGQRPVRSF